MKPPTVTSQGVARRATTFKPTVAFLFSAICDLVWIYSLNVTTIKIDPGIFHPMKRHILYPFCLFVGRLEEFVAFGFVAHPLVELEQLQTGQPRDRRSGDAKRKLYES